MDIATKKMTPTRLRSLCIGLQWAGRTHVVLHGMPSPPIKGFPRGELLCVNSAGQKVRSYPIAKVLAWLDKEGI
jgi:hypothetical protein